LLIAVVFRKEWFAILGDILASPSGCVVMWFWDIARCRKAILNLTARAGERTMYMEQKPQHQRINRAFEVSWAGLKEFCVLSPSFRN
jgi:hypothetical protein